MTERGADRRVVVVTGANSGIGRALAGRLVSAGHVVLGVDRQVDAVPSGVQGVRCDLADPASVVTAVETITDGLDATQVGKIDQLAAVAGVPGTAAPAMVVQVNLLGTRQFTELLLPHLGASASVVLVSSMAGYKGPATPEEAVRLLAERDEDVLGHVRRLELDGPTAYQLSKQLIHCYAVELSARLHPRGIRCSSVSPGPVVTPILADFRATMPTLDLAGAMVGRHARPDEIADVIAFLLSPQASWINGIDLRLDGGLGALRSVRPAPRSTASSDRRDETPAGLPLR